MPKRWLSLRGRQQHNSPVIEHTSSDKAKQDFDFAFSAETPASFSTALPSRDTQFRTTPYDERPTMARGIENRPRKQLRIDVDATRPKTSGDNRASTLQLAHHHNTSRSHEDLIGIAFGSPSHPPSTFRSLAGQMSPMVTDHAFGQQGPFPERQRRLLPKSWKKIGSLFAPKNSGLEHGPPLTSSPALSQEPVQHKAVDNQSKHPWLRYRLHVPEQPTRRPPPPPVQIEYVDETFEEACRRKSSSEGKTMLLDPTPIPSPHVVEQIRKSVERPVRLSSLPKLEVSIPNPPLDRYTVMFKDVSQSSNLLARRSKTLESLKSPDLKHESSRMPEAKHIIEPLPEGELLPARRMTDPKLPKPEFAMKASTSSPTVSKYSLFPPASPAPIKIIGKIHHESPLKRTVSSPARLSPMEPTFPKEKPRVVTDPRKPSAMHDVISPATNTASTDATEPCWSAVHSIKSSVSSSNTEEIFFDIRNFRDSKGIEDGQHFVMARPESAVVNLARTRSKLNKSSTRRKPEPPTLSRPTIPAARADRHDSISSVNTAVFDEAIAAVEELTSPQSRKEVSQEARMGLVKSQPASASSPPRSNVSRQSSLNKADLALKLLPPDPGMPTKGSKSRPDQPHSITVPSPIIEEASPSSNKTVTISPEKPIANQAKSRDPSPMPPQPRFNESARKAAPDSRSATPTEKASSNLPLRKPMAAAVAMKPQHTSQPSLSKSPQMIAVRRMDHPIEESPTIPQGPPPRPYSPAEALLLGNKGPPVPKKDSKFIPISKFAARSTVARVEQVGVKPARLARSATDTLVVEAHQTGKKLTGLRKAERSQTIESVSPTAPQAQPRPVVQQASKSDFDIARTVSAKNSPQLGQNGVHTVTAVVQAKPAAEVSVARTVSLARKQSARVLVPGPKLAARRKEEELRRNGTDSATTSATATPVLVTISSPKESEQEQATPQLEEREQQHKPSISSSSDISAPSPAKARLNPLMSNPTDSQISLVSQTSHVSQRSYQSEISTMSKAQERVDKDLIEKFKDKDKSKWDVVESKRMSPVVVIQGERGHKPGASVGVVLDMA